MSSEKISGSLPAEPTAIMLREIECSDFSEKAPDEILEDFAKKYKLIPTRVGAISNKIIFRDGTGNRKEQIIQTKQGWIRLVFTANRIGYEPANVTPASAQTICLENRATEKEILG